MPDEKPILKLPSVGIDPLLLDAYREYEGSLVQGVHAEDFASTDPSASTLPTQQILATIAVLPFSDAAGGSDSEYFAEGIAEDILTELSRFRNLLVIARNSSSVFRGKNLDIKAVSKHLKVDYIATGNVRRAGNRIRVAVQLTYAPSGHEVWAERYDRDIVDIFAVQDDIVRTVAVTLESRLGQAIANQAAPRSVPSLAAYECLLLARKFAEVHDPDRAMPYAERALALDPSSSQAHAMISHCAYTKWLREPDDEILQKMVQSAHSAVLLDPGNASAHAILGMALTSQRKYDEAGSHLERALSLNPGDTKALAYHSEWLLRMGDAEGALRTLDDALLRDPIPPPWHWEIRGLILILLEKYADAIHAFARQTKQFWYIAAYLAICFAKLGRIDEARTELRKALEVVPDHNLLRFRIVDEFQSQSFREKLSEGLTLAGLD
ncbi:tetratricopeptide repeat protein [Mesorhizobium sp. Cs1321R2N1]|uniref:tetratricopeptide repeat protein n=1 Tax=Mesorhizobium sp. Cs1321R2N1 TaxID=3015174 RepID=UPI00301C6710